MGIVLSEACYNRSTRRNVLLTIRWRAHIRSRRNSSTLVNIMLIVVDLSVPQWSPIRTPSVLIEGVRVIVTAPTITMVTNIIQTPVL